MVWLLDCRDNTWVSLCKVRCDFQSNAQDKIELHFIFRIFSDSSKLSSVNMQHKQKPNNEDSF